ncbi:polysaccharide biosynthesis tyrosine autokinase [Aeromicrobium sp.]|uniref:polysaccharide biosynthesis tyrosine autokinase n=1 Tax=Aeromicrobium sp. TaxID=1871063 RepID=UPI0040337C36
MELRQFLGALRMRWVFSTVTFLVGAAITAAVVLLMTPQYGSSVKLFVSTPSGGSAEYAASFIVTQRVASYAELATDPSVLQRVIDKLDLDASYEDLEGQVSASVITGTQTIELDVTADTPELAQQIAKAEAEEVVALVEQLERPAVKDEEPAIAARIAAEPSISDTPVSPNLPLNIGIGLLLSLFVAIVGALLRDLLDRTVKSRQDAEKISGHSVLVTLPYDPQVKKTPLATEAGGSLAEAFRVLRTNLQFADLDSQRQAILVSSALPDEGKTLVATNLALTMAQSGRSVLLIDADMRNPNVAELLGLENSVGVVTVLVGRTSIDEATQPHSSGISFLGTGPTPPNPAEVLDTQAMRDLIARVRKDYDAVIIDAPPMLPVADASILLTEVDGALLLVRHGSTTREQLRLAVSRIETVGGRLFGTILNRTPRRVGDADGYGYGYGHGYGYGYAPTVDTDSTPTAAPAAPPDPEPGGRRIGRRVKR